MIVVDKVAEKKKDNKWYYEYRKRIGVCTRCGKQDDFTLLGRTICAECLKKRNNNKKYQDTYPKYKEKYIAKLKQNHKCIRCGAKLLDNSKKLTCERCARKQSEYDRKKRIISGVNYPRGDNGLCFQCNKRPAVEGYRLCEECYAKKVETNRLIAKNRKKGMKENGSANERSREIGEAKENNDYRA